MSALSFARQAFGRGKPHSSITDWVDILTSSNIKDEAYDGIPELVDSINLQAAGPTEASRALRKKLKHGDTHHQYRALVILKALVENCGQKFQSTFADGHLTDALKNIANDPNADKRVKKKLILVLGSWRDQFKSDPSMALVAGLYKQCRGDSRRIGQQELPEVGEYLVSPQPEDKKAEKEDLKKKEQQERAAKAQDRQKKKRSPFDFEKERPKVLESIVDGSQASSNLINAITLVNRAHDSLETNARVQECLTTAKQVKKLVVRYTQLVENDELIGTLIETNDRLVFALEMYDHSIATDPEAETEDTRVITTGIAAVNVGLPNSAMRYEHNEKGKDRGPSSPTYIHPDLEDLNFGPLGNSSTKLPPPIQPSTLSDDGFDQDNQDHRGSLSDFSDYESSDEETHSTNAGPSSKRNYVTVSDNDGEDSIPFRNSRVQTQAHDDPFADPFADDAAK